MAFVTGFNGTGCCSNGNGGGTAAEWTTTMQEFTIEREFLPGETFTLNHVPRTIYNVRPLYDSAPMHYGADYIMDDANLILLFDDDEPTPENSIKLQVVYDHNL